MTTFKDLNQFLEPWCPVKVASKKYPQGKVYQAPEPNINLGLRIILFLDRSENTELTDIEEYDLYQELLGPVWDEMRDDGCSMPTILLAGRAVLVYWGISPQKALDYIAGDDPGKALPSMRNPAILWRWIFRSPVRTGQTIPAEVR